MSEVTSIRRLSGDPAKEPLVVSPTAVNGRSQGEHTGRATPRTPGDSNAPRKGKFYEGRFPMMEVRGDAGDTGEACDAVHDAERTSARALAGR